MLSVILIGVSLSMDAFAVSVTNGLTLRPFKTSYALWHGLYFGAFQCLMPLAGYVLGSTIAGYVTAIGPYVSFFLLAFIGGKMIFEAVKGGEEGSGGMTVLSHKRLLALAVATSIDALAVGVSFAFSPPSPGTVLSCVVIGCTTFLIAFGGMMAASRIPGIHPKKAEIAGGVVLVGIGVKLLLEGLL